MAERDVRLGLTLTELESIARLGFARFWCGHYRCGSGVSFHGGGRYRDPYFNCAWHGEMEPEYVILVEPDWSRDDGGLPNYDWGPT